VSLLIAGLVVFFGIHLLPLVPGARNALALRMGERGYKGTFALVSLVGLVLIVMGFGRTDSQRLLFQPWPIARVAARELVPIAFILLASSHMRGYIRATLKHPMMIGVAIWALVHLLANGDVPGTLVFGAFFVYAVVDIVSATARGAYETFKPVLRHDFIAVGAGLLVALVVMSLHRVLFGVQVVSFGL
jgi:uncharacterized membrane protein